MANTPSNPRAFPSGESYVTHDMAGCMAGCTREHSKAPLNAGMSLRDYFAGESCKGGADAICDNLSEDGEDKAREHAARHAKAAYMVADAMLAERERVK